MENTIQEDKTQGKTLIVNPQIHKILSLMKIEGEFKSADKLIESLIESHKKLKAIEESEKQKKELKNGKRK